MIGRLIAISATATLLSGLATPGNAQGHRLDYVPGQETQEPGRQERGPAARQPGTAEVTPDQPMQDAGKIPSSAGRSNAIPPSRPATSGQSSGRNKDEAPKPQAR